MLLDKTLEELDGIDWGEPTSHNSLAIDCHRLRRAALKDFTDFDLACMVRQKFSLDRLVPIAFARLLDEPFAGESYDGDLVSAVLALPAEFWIGYLDLAQSLKSVVKNAFDQLPVYIEANGEIEASDELEVETAKLLHDYKFTTLK